MLIGTLTISRLSSLSNNYQMSLKARTVTTDALQNVDAVLFYIHVFFLNRNQGQAKQL
uniref:Uncharacterized protein n=1 Tax=Arundo donax TaxID=35708 RepID=A0A0A9DUE9_ARUDO